MNADFGKQLSAPFSASDIEWRVQSCGKNGSNIWAIVMPYIQNRAIMERLDSVVGPENWQNAYTKGPEGGILCGLSIKIGSEWVTKWDGAANTEVKEGGKLDEDTNIKGGLSASMKRAGVQWGIGRYLYKLEASFAIIDPKGQYRGKTKENESFKWNPPDLPSWALPEGDSAETPEFTRIKKQLSGEITANPPTLNAKWIEYANRAINGKNLDAMKTALAEAIKNKETGK